MRIKSLARIGCFAGVVNATYNAATTDIDDACALIRQTILTTVTVVVDAQGTWAQTGGISPTADWKPAGSWDQSSPPGKDYGGEWTEANKALSSSVTKKGGYGQGEWTEEAAPSPTKYQDHGDSHSPATAVEISKSWEDNRPAHGYGVGEDPDCTSAAAESLAYLAKPSYGDGGSAASTHLDHHTAGYSADHSNPRVSGGVYGHEQSQHSPTTIGSHGPSKFPHRNSVSSSSVSHSSGTSTWHTRNLLSASSTSSSTKSSFVTSFSSSNAASTTSSVTSSSSSVLPSCIPDLLTGCTSNSQCCNVVLGSTCVNSTCSPCVPVTPGNAVVNGGFGTGQLAPWTESYTGNWVGGLGVEPDSDSQDGDGYDWVGVLTSSTGTATLTQTNVAILDGTTVSCTAYGKSSDNNPFSATFVISIDGVQCGTIVQASAPGAPNNGWQQFGGNLQVSGNTHTVVVTATGNNVDDAGASLNLDNVQVVPIAGPGSLPVGCPPS